MLCWLTPITAVDAGTYWGKAKKWDNRQGRMTISGDASHPITPRRFAVISLNFIVTGLKVPAVPSGILC